VEERICRNCCYYENRDYDQSFCHRYPPIEGRHELVQKDDWCGEFVSKAIIEIDRLRKIQRR